MLVMNSFWTINYYNPEKNHKLERNVCTFNFLIFYILLCYFSEYDSAIKSDKIIPTRSTIVK